MIKKVIVESMLPKNITITLEGDNLIINQQWFSSKYNWSLMVGICFLGFISLIFWGEIPNLILLPYILIGIGTICYGIIGIINHTIIIISPTKLSIVCKPIPCINKITLNCNSITQLVVKEKIIKTRNSYQWQCTLYAITLNDKKIKLLENIPTPKHGQYLEIYIGKHLGLENKEVLLKYQSKAKILKTIKAIDDEICTLLSNIPYLHQTKNRNIFKATGNYKNYYLTVDILPTITTKITLTAPNTQITATPNNITSATPKILSRDEIKQLFYSINGTVKTKNNGQYISYITKKNINSAAELETLFKQLRAILENYANIIHTGGAIIPELHYISQQKDHSLRMIAIELLEIIIQQNMAHFGENPTQWLCLNCLSRYIAYNININLFKTLTYYACKTCGKSHTAYQNPMQVILVLDNTVQKKHFERNNAFCINWFKHKTFFDFDAVEIIAATDKDVERLAIQVGNNADPARKLAYKQIPFTVNPTCTLSENSLKLLARIFQLKS